MDLSKNDILNSGLLELYAIGSISDEDRQIVESALAAYPELVEEVRDIEITLEQYTRAHAIQPDPSLKDKILSQIKDKPSSSDAVPRRSNPLNWQNGAMIILLTLLAWQWLKSMRDNTVLTDQNQQISQSCDSIQNQMNERIVTLENILSGNSRIIPVSPTEKFPETQLYFHLDSDQRSNFLQVKNLPNLADNQSFQLWSLKEGQDPIPLDVFQGTEDIIIPVQFVDATNAYAITIEPEGGSQSPTLENLIGVFNI